MDEVAKWSQRWAHIPEKGAVSFAHTVCKLCPGGCGIKVRLVEAKNAVKIDGNPNYPVNLGGICPLGASGLQFLYHGQVRATAPLKRSGPRGAGVFKQITWTEALNELSGKLKALRDEGKSHTVAVMNGLNRGTLSEVWERFLTAYGSPNLLRPLSMEDSYRAVFALTQGKKASPALDLAGAKYILSFGSGLADGWGSPLSTLSAVRKWREGGEAKGRTKLVQVDARSSATAGFADEWVAIAPGSEGELALGLANLIIQKGLYDEALVRGASGFEGFKELVAREYSPEAVSKVTGVPVRDLERIARDFATRKPALALSGKDKGLHAGSLFEFLAVQALNALTGSLGRSGGIFPQTSLPLTPWPGLNLDAVAQKGLNEGRLDGAGSEFPLAESLVEQFMDRAAKGEKYPINILMVSEWNPIFSALEAEAMIRAWGKIPLVVSFSSFIDETTVYADLVLPASLYLERWEDAYTPFGLPAPTYGLGAPVLKPVFDTKAPGEVILQLAEKLGGSVAQSLPWKSFEEVLKFRAQGLAKANGRLTDAEGTKPESADKLWEGLLAHGGWTQADFALGGAVKFDFQAQNLAKGAPKTAPKGDKEGALTLVPYEFLLIQDGYPGNAPFMTKYLEDTLLKGKALFVDINPDTAKALGVKEGEERMIESPRGKLKVRMHLFEGARPGALFIPVGLGHTALDETLKDKGVNPRAVLEPVRDPLSGFTLVCATPVKLTR
jgi:anaerobic selenocysteine-containing dehydrogenase